MVAIRHLGAGAAIESSCGRQIKGAEMVMGDGNGPRRWQVCESRAAVCEARVERGLLLHLVDGDN